MINMRYQKSRANRFTNINMLIVLLLSLITFTAQASQFGDVIPKPVVVEEPECE